MSELFHSSTDGLRTVLLTHQRASLPALVSKSVREAGQMALEFSRRIFRMKSSRWNP